MTRPTPICHPTVLRGASLSITIHDAPLGKGRPRVDFAHRRTFTPPKTRAWEARAATAVADALPPGWTPLTGPVVVVVDAVFPRPESLRCKHRRACSCREDGRLERRPHVASPDADNVLKAVCDALEKGGAIGNDRTVWQATVRKWIAAEGEVPSVRVEVTPANHAAAEAALED